MSSLKPADRNYLEKLLGMGGGFVLEYSDSSFGGFFKRFGIDIHSSRYHTYGPSKAKKLRSFWDQADDALVAQVMTEMLDEYEADCELSDVEPDHSLLAKVRTIIGSLAPQSEARSEPADKVDDFLAQEFAFPNVHKLPIEDAVASIIGQRLDEATTALRARAYLSVVLLCGSVLEAVLLGAARSEPAAFNQSNCSPKSDNGKVLPLHEWKLAALIDTACDLGKLKPDVQKFGHGLRDFRNYIHPYQQLASGFSPDEHTAKVCFQVLKAALASIAGERG